MFSPFSGGARRQSSKTMSVVTSRGEVRVISLSHTDEQSQPTELTHHIVRPVRCVCRVRRGRMYLTRFSVWRGQGKGVPPGRVDLAGPFVPVRTDPSDTSTGLCRETWHTALRARDPSLLLRRRLQQQRGERESGWPTPPDFDVDGSSGRNIST